MDCAGQTTTPQSSSRSATVNALAPYQPDHLSRFYAGRCAQSPARTPSSAGRSILLQQPATSPEATLREPDPGWSPALKLAAGHPSCVPMMLALPGRAVLEARLRTIARGSPWSVQSGVYVRTTINSSVLLKARAVWAFQQRWLQRRLALGTSPPGFAPVKGRSAQSPLRGPPRAARDGLRASA